MGHLVRRFLGALWPGAPRAEDRRWVASVVRPGEQALFRRLPHHDQRHLIRVARRVDARLVGGEHGGEERWLAAALLHDVGKVDAGLGIPGRVVATVCRRVGGPGLEGAWRTREGWRGRAARYLRHGELGAALIRTAGGHEEAAVWCRAHDRPDERARAGFPSEVVAALVDADG